MGETRSVKTKQFDRVLLITTMMLVFVGAVMVYSTTSIVAPSRGGTSVVSSVSTSLIDLRYLKKHVVSVLLGIVLMTVFYKLPLVALKRSAFVLLGLAALLLIAVKMPFIGLTVNGARRWIHIAHFTFQPSELVKPALIIFLARYLSSKTFNPDSFKSFMIPIAMMGVLQGLLLLQPDFGSSVILGIITFSLLFAARVRVKFILSLGILLIPVVIKLIMKPYRLQRIMVFLDPWADEKNTGFQLIQSFVAFGNGGLKGLGVGKSTQKLFFLPEAKTDFIFSIVGEEIGFIGATVVVILFLIVFIRGVLITGRQKEPYLYYLSAGFTTLIGVQAVLNLSVVTGLMPTKGLPLPFISYGGTSMIMNLIEVGILLNIAKGDSEEHIPVVNPQVDIYSGMREKIMRQRGRIISDVKWKT
ncbi:putative lipid II flippase FtsW [Candidatus Magnetomonas plexicatena]|uniref:putative lipid II flippase FtsW n=1 Tax=Candidatus Magnetomonas plexicatena TaxID=2552947 RepID=UPI001C784BD3|nr:putative lipid II flippase FtsW [Nitrospirales bacterium LBB_01]